MPLRATHHTPGCGGLRDPRPTHHSVRARWARPAILCLVQDSCNHFTMSYAAYRRARDTLTEHYEKGELTQQAYERELALVEFMRDKQVNALTRAGFTHTSHDQGGPALLLLCKRRSDVERHITSLISRSDFQCTSRERIRL